MTLLELKKHLCDGREIEFALNSKHYFLSSDWGDESSENEFYVFDNEQKKIIAEGNLQEILSFEFHPSISFQSNINLFSFEYIL